ncbi:putative peptidyl-prolyl cis-trans isomerase [Anatilimnocola aggregata]|uniref:peptidylprolyl isomerase n=1 Tax=Anatilimnocola aggregata TaxID=2528021 RepID=A0A517Y4B1_9BACT|nr:peptidylprolyl isomerase [Anatilimnocola aggregata]QDU25083.1 putative peptidyl-prolyl cis-trans isomerase [Anatilimnocola aggregata]
MLTKFRLAPWSFCLTLSTLSLLLGNMAVAQPGTESPKKAETKQPAAETKEAEAKPAAGEGDYNALLNRWKTVIDDLRKLKLKYAVAQAGEREALDKQWEELIAEGNKLVPELQAAGKKAYEAAPNQDPQLTRFLVKMAADDAANDHYKSAFDLAEVLIKNDCGEKQIYNTAAIAAFCLNDFTKAEEYFKVAQEGGALSPPGDEYSGETAAYKGFWEQEQKLREAEAAANDLPRVKIQTTKGEIVLELFENEAPDTVGNFISLVEKKAYDGTPFHRVLKGFMAQGGDPKGDGTGGPGYQIYCELDKPNFRKHFAGSLSMAHAGKDTGGSQFFLTFRATPHLNGRHTCFGRVISGMDVLENLQRRDPSAPTKVEPDKIVTATVERKRDHAYVPKKVE